MTSQLAPTADALISTPLLLLLLLLLMMMMMMMILTHSTLKLAWRIYFQL